MNNILQVAIVALLCCYATARASDEDLEVIEIYCGNTLENPQFKGSGVPFSLRGINYVVTARHVVFRDDGEHSYNFVWAGDGPGQRISLEFEWGNRDLDIAVLKYNHDNSFPSSSLRRTQQLPRTDSLEIIRLGKTTTIGELRCRFEGSTPNPIPIVARSISDTQPGRIKVQVIDTTVYKLSRGMSGGLVFAGDKLLGMLSSADPKTGFASIVRWDLVRSLAVGHLNTLPIQSCLQSIEARGTRFKRWMYASGVLLVPAAILAGKFQVDANKDYDKYSSAVSVEEINSAWTDYENTLLRRNISIGVAGALVLSEVIAYWMSVVNNSRREKCLDGEMAISHLSFRMDHGSLLLVYRW